MIKIGDCKKKSIHEFEVKEISKFLSKKECDFLIKKGEPYLETSKIYSLSAMNITCNSRTGKTATLNHDNRVLNKIKEKVHKINNLPIENQEPPQLVYYDIGQEFKYHYDS